MNPRFEWSVSAIAAVFALLALALILTQRPGCDEAWFGGPAYNLAFHGYMGTPALEPTTAFQEGRSFYGIDRHTYWIMPLSPLLHAVWFQIVGFSLVSMRSISLLSGIVALFAWVKVLRKFAVGDRQILLTIALIALDFAFIRSGGHGRMDMLCAALNVSALASYLAFRDTSFIRALLVSSTLGALSLLTHPNGIFGIVGVVFLAWSYDRQRLRWWHAGVAASPFLLGAAAWAIYIQQAPDAFVIQFRGNSAGRFWGLSDPLRALLVELHERYAPGTGMIATLRLVQAIPYALGFGLAATTPAVRRHPGYRAILWLAGFEFFYFWLLEGTKLYLYTVHISSLCMLLLAAGLMNAALNTTGLHARIPRGVQRTAFAMWLLVQVGGVAYVVRRNDFNRSYLPAITYLKDHVPPSAMVMGSAELGFQLGFSDRLVDDVKLGSVSGKQPDIVVLERRYEDWFGYAKQKEPDTYRHIQKLLGEDLHLVYEQAGYRIYGRTAAETTPRP
jgi:hypothetical protein